MANGFLKPPLWIFNKRFWFLGLFVGAFIFVQKIEFNFSIFTSASLHNFLLISSICTIICGVTWELYFSEIRKNTNLLLLQDEEEILSDSAVLSTSNWTEKGRVILTNERLSFIVNNRGKSQYDFYFKDFKGEFEIVKKFGVPVQLKIPNKAIYIKVNFPKLWKARIKQFS